MVGTPIGSKKLKLIGKNRYSNVTRLQSRLPHTSLTSGFLTYNGIIGFPADAHPHSQRWGAAALRFRKIKEPANHAGWQSLPFVWAGGITRIAVAGWANAAARATMYATKGLCGWIGYPITVNYIVRICMLNEFTGSSCVGCQLSP